MSESNPIFSPPRVGRGAAGDAEERQIALEYLAEAWNTAEADGVESEALAHASLFAALATLGCVMQPLRGKGTEAPWC